MTTKRSDLFYRLHFSSQRLDLHPISRRYTISESFPEENICHWKKRQELKTNSQKESKELCEQVKKKEEKKEISDANRRK